jgi:hypothetical protein
MISFVRWRDSTTSCTAPASTGIECSSTIGMGIWSNRMPRRYGEF